MIEAARTPARSPKESHAGFRQLVARPWCLRHRRGRHACGLCGAQRLARLCRGPPWRVTAAEARLCRGSQSPGARQGDRGDRASWALPRQCEPSARSRAGTDARGLPAAQFGQGRARGPHRRPGDHRRALHRGCAGFCPGRRARPGVRACRHPHRLHAAYPAFRRRADRLGHGRDRDRGPVNALWRAARAFCLLSPRQRDRATRRRGGPAARGTRCMVRRAGGTIARAARCPQSSQGVA